ncbi:MAG: hypothetical protein ACRCZC_05245, partial [Culicoidibacterales bacterium]
DDPKIDDIISEEAPVLEGDREQLRISASRAVNDKKFFDGLNGANFNDPEFQRLYLEAGGSIKELRKKTSDANGLSSAEAASIDRIRSQNGEYEDLDLSDQQLKLKDTLVRGAVSKGATFENELTAKIAEIEHDDNLGKGVFDRVTGKYLDPADLSKEITKERTKEIKEQEKMNAVANYEKRYFGNDSALIIDSSADLNTLENTELGKMISKNAEYQSLDAAAKKNLIVASMEDVRQNWNSNFYGSRGDAENPITKQTRFDQVAGQYAKQLQNASGKYNKIVEQKLGSSSYNKNVQELHKQAMKSGNGHMLFDESNTEVQAILGAKAYGSSVENDINKLGAVDISGTKYEFNDMDTESRKVFMGLTNRYVAAVTGGDNEQIKKLETEITSK